MVGFHIENFGCRAARADGEAVSSRLLAAGHCMQQLREADVILVNTCSVTAEADREARAFIRRAHRANPSARIVVTGCYAQRAPGELASLDGVAAVIGNSHKALAPQIAAGLAQDCFDIPQKSASAIRPGAGILEAELTSRAWAGSLVSGHGFSRAEETAKRTGALAPERALPRASPNLVRVETLLSSGASSGAPVDSAPISPAPIWADDRFAHSFIEETQIVPGAQTRPNLKIQEGCGNRCTFCVIPLTRGPSRSLPHAVVLRQVEGFVAAGGRELVLSGINLGRWGRDLSVAFSRNESKGTGFSPYASTLQMERASAPERSASHTLASLVRKILVQTTLPRLRLSSIEPMDWDSELIALMAEFAETRLARHAHLPLQSGSDAVLRRMHRRYRPWHYAQKVEALFSAAGDDLTLGADVMAGFPGESDAEFEETLGFLRALPFGYLHLFPFSPRPGTPGWALHAQSPVAPGIVEERMAALRLLAAEKSRAHRARFLGRALSAITMHTPPALGALGRTSALTDNFLPVEIEGRLPANRLVRVRISGFTPQGALQGTLRGNARETALD
jgi:threonylcarbamoyladenosine tRNA methylthiotransferase MtaB